MFACLVNEIALDLAVNVHFATSAIPALHEAAETYIVCQTLCNTWYKHITIMLREIHQAYHTHEEIDIYIH